MGEALFVKGKRPLQATPLGVQLASHGREILAASRRASDTLQGFLKGTRGLVRVGGVNFFMDAMISRMVAGFQNWNRMWRCSKAMATCPTCHRRWRMT